jgi:hypothetical protein
MFAARALARQRVSSDQSPFQNPNVTHCHASRPYPSCSPFPIPVYDPCQPATSVPASLGVIQALSKLVNTFRSSALRSSRNSTFPFWALYQDTFSAPHVSSTSHDFGRNIRRDSVEPRREEQHTRMQKKSQRDNMRNLYPYSKFCNEILQYGE